ncbi:hypothetical protein DWF00_16595 [Bosea caraganae]|uniref:Tail fiber domain-containing protein n=1 Tax=Bosea caraganae TaxID=2763117 RepID=A0A370KYR5_9HYPH|nr:hypothetical protein [Bosea caraganae]RDJ20128.1 hypothetical protein DWE98_26200 [Bosea caraganae]RDJ24840.1 hypothetical protein DWF00_16595 [Bosea caraganae]
MADPFSGRQGRLTGMWAADQAQNTGNSISALLNTGQTNALGSIGTGRTNSLASLGQGYDAAVPQYQEAIGRFDPWAEAGRGALTTYQNSLGQNGAAGNAAAVSQFQASPSYQYQVDQATDAVARKASALGALGSGNTQAAITDRASQLANQEYGGWQDRLNGLSTQGLQATGAQAALQRGLGDLGVQRGRDESNIYDNAAGREAGIYSNFAGLGASNLANLGQQTISAGTGALMAGQDAAANKLNFGMNIAKTGLSLLGGGLGGLGGLAGGALFGGGGTVSNALGAATNFQPFGDGTKW